jgi:hypothetical protein
MIMIVSLIYWVIRGKYRALILIFGGFLKGTRVVHEKPTDLFLVLGQDLDLIR